MFLDFIIAQICENKIVFVSTSQSRVQVFVNHFIRDLVESKTIALDFVETE